MTHFGTIKSYDSDKGTGTIAPEKGGNALPFGRKDLQQHAAEPNVDERYGYNTCEVNGRDKRAINLSPQRDDCTSPHAEQARAQHG